MGLFDALSGKIEYFNSIVVFTHNEIGKRIKNLKDEEAVLFFAAVLELIASKLIVHFFKEGKLVRVVKNYTADDIKKLYAVLIIWSAVDFTNLGMDQKEIRGLLKQILNRSEKDFNDMWQLLRHKEKGELRKLWVEIAKILKFDLENEEAFLSFSINYSKIAKQCYAELEKTSKQEINL